MNRRTNNLHTAIEQLGNAIARLDVSDSQSIARVRDRYVVVVNNSAAVAGHAGDLAVALGFECSPSRRVEA